MKQNTFFKPEVQFFFPRLFDGKILYFLISHQNLQVCQLWERTAIISHHSMSKFKKILDSHLLSLELLTKVWGLHSLLTAPNLCSDTANQSICLWSLPPARLLHRISQINMKKLIQMSLPTAVQFSFPLLLWITSPGEFQALLEMCVIQSLKLSILTI